jgi:hypothetical protein
VAWERLAYPFEAAYACFRQAEALLAGGPMHAQAESVLRPAHQMVVALGAAPLRREIELLAKARPPPPGATGGDARSTNGALLGGRLAWPNPA